MQKRSSLELKKKIQVQNMIIIALVIIIVVLMAISGTAAWYIRTKSDSADIILSNPVNIYITEFEEMKDGSGRQIVDGDGNPVLNHVTTEDILEGYNSRIYPGDNIKLKLGMQLGTRAEPSSPAFVRVKLSIAWIKISTGEQLQLSDLAQDNMITYKDTPNEDNWKLLDFNKYSTDEDVQPDYWYVYKEGSGASESARIARSLEQIEFLNGYINLNKQEITNAQANCKLTINYIVEAIQVPNVPDPIAEEGKGPWWHYALGDTD